MFSRPRFYSFPFPPNNPSSQIDKSIAPQIHRSENPSLESLHRSANPANLKSIAPSLCKYVARVVGAVPFHHHSRLQFIARVVGVDKVIHLIRILNFGPRINVDMDVRFK